MANEGATTVGSIDAKIGMDLDQWRAGVAEIQASARELGTLNPDITVEANTGRAEAAMAAVDATAAAMGVSASTGAQRVKSAADDVAAAEARKTVALQAADAAIARALIAQQRLTEAEESGRTKASTLMAAQLALSEAVKRLDTANEKALASEAALAAAQEAARGSAQRQAGSETENAAATTAAGNASGGAAARTILLTTAIAALALVAAPLTGTVVGLGGALTGLGAAGVLGIIGIVSAMKQGTDVGQQYSNTLHTVKGDLDGLAGTAATTLLGSFQSSVRMISGDMPQLNAQVQWFAAELGVIGTTALSGVINGLNVLNPLFVQATNYSKSLASGFAAWTSNGGLQKFADFASATFPLVTHTLGDLVGAVVQLVTALAPVGSVLLGIVDVGAQLISWVASFGPGLAVVAGGAAAAFGAFKLWEGIGPILSVVTTAAETATGGITALGIAMDVSSGEIGWVIAGVAALAAAVGIGSAATEKSTQATQDYTTALKQDNDAIGVNVRATAAKKLLDAGALTAATKLGISTSMLTDAVLGNKDAYKTVGSTLTDVTKTLDTAAGKNGQLTDAQSATAAAAQKVADTVRDQSGALHKAVSDSKELKAATDGATASADASATSSAGAATAYLNASSNVQTWVTELDNLIDAMNKANGVGQDAVTTNATYQDALAKVKDTITKAKEGVQGYSTSIDQSTVAGADNASMFAQLAQQSQAAAKAQFDVDHNAQAYQGTLNAGKQALIDQITNLTGNATAAQQLADKIYQIPDQKTITMLDNAATTQTNVDNLNKAINGLTDRKTITIVEEIQQVLSQVDAGREQKQHGNGTAFGGTIGHFAGGGSVIGPGSSQSDTAGLYALSNGEEVTSNYFGQASQYRSLLKMINANSPAGQIAGKAMQIAGVAPSVDSGGKGKQVTHVHHWYVQSNNGEQLYQDFTRKTNAKEGP